MLCYYVIIRYSALDAASRTPAPLPLLGAPLCVLWVVCGGERKNKVRFSSKSKSKLDRAGVNQPALTADAPRGERER